MDKNLSYFIYALPKSSPEGHRVKDKNTCQGLKKAFNAFAANFSGVQSGSVRLELFYIQEEKDEVLLAKSSIPKINDFLGKPARKWKNTNSVFIRHHVVWENDSKNIQDIVEYLEAQTENFLALTHFITTQFYHYGTKINENAQILYTVESGKLFVKVNLILPFSIDKSYEIIRNLCHEAPFKLNPKNFRRLGHNKKNSYGLWQLNEETHKLLNSYIK